MSRVILRRWPWGMHLAGSPVGFITVGIWVAGCIFIRWSLEVWGRVFWSVIRCVRVDFFAVMAQTAWVRVWMVYQVHFRLSADLEAKAHALWPLTRLLTWILCTGFRCIDLRLYQARPYDKCVSRTRVLHKFSKTQFCKNSFLMQNYVWKTLFKISIFIFSRALQKVMVELWVFGRVAKRN